MSESDTEKHVHIRLESMVTRRKQVGPNRVEQTISGIVNQLHHSTMTLLFPLPLFEFQGYGVSASPVSSLDESRLTLSLDQWTFFDHERNQKIPAVILPISNPDSPAAWDFVRLYARTARHLDNDQLERWGASVMAGMADAAAEQAVQAFAEGGDERVDTDS